MTNSLLRTPLHDWHAAHGGRMVDFAGWSMPVQYTTIVDEHQATRTAIGLFDISHMGRLRFDGDNAAELLEGILSRRVTNLKPGDIRYALVTQERGGILDDVLVYHLTQPDGTPYHLLVVNASNRVKIVQWLSAQLGGEPSFVDQTQETAMIAVQGPQAIQCASQVLGFDISAMKYYTGQTRELQGARVLVSRTGYTGEDGCELVVPAELAEGIWNDLLTQGEASGAQAAGLGARDTLRLEAAMPLYGHELNEDIDPLTAGLGFAVHLKERQFPGCEALAKIKQDGPQRVRIGLELDGRRVPREHYPVMLDGKAVGEVTSGTFSPTLQKPIAMAYVEAAQAESSELRIDIRGKQEPARVVPLPFYQRPSR